MTRRPKPASLQLVFDASRCDGHGMCSLVFPERISLDPWGYAVADREPITDRRTRRRAHAAVRCCPAGALSLVAGPPPRDSSALSAKSVPAAAIGDATGQE